MNLKDGFKDFLIKKIGLASGTADDYVSHINRISECFDVRIGDLFDPNSISVFGRLDDASIKNTDYDRWMNALRYYIEFLNQL